MVKIDLEKQQKKFEELKKKLGEINLQLESTMQALGFAKDDVIDVDSIKMTPELKQIWDKVQEEANTEAQRAVLRMKDETEKATASCKPGLRRGILSI